MTTPLQAQLLDTIDGELADARLALQQAQDRIDEAQAMREVFVELLTAPPASGETMDETLARRAAEPTEFRRMVLSALDEQTPHSARELAERLDLDPNDANLVQKITHHVKFLIKADRAKVVGKRLNTNTPSGGRRGGMPANFYVKLSVNGDGQPREREIIWP